MFKRNTSNVNFFLNVIYFLILLSSIYQFVINVKTNFPIEFFINYNEGFVRRGLVGSLIYGLLNAFDLNSYYFALLFVWVLIFINLLIIISTTLKHKIGWFFLLTSPMLLNMYTKGIPFRLDLVIFPLLFFQLLILKHKKIPVYSKLLLTSFFMCIGILVHEIYIIVSIVTFSFIVCYHLKQRSLVSYLFLIPPCCLFIILSLFFKGNEIQINKVILSWERFGIDPIQLNYLNWLFSLEGPIFLWNNKNFLDSKVVLIGFFLNYITVCFFVYNYLKLIFVIENKFQKFLILANFLTILFLCLIAEDFVRWFYFMTIITLFYFVFFVKKKKLVIDRKYLIIKFLFLFIGVPMVGTWSFYLFFWTSPIRSLVYYYYYLL